MNTNNEFYQNSMINARKDNDEWKNAAGTCSPNLIEKSITENGEYSAKADNVDGYSFVTVDVAGGGGGETITVNIAFTISGTTTANVVTSKTYQETLDAINSGKNISFEVTVNGTENPIICYGIYNEPGLENVILLVVAVTGGTRMIWWYDDGTEALFTKIEALFAVIPNA